jgi:hypothetical protein
MPRSRLFEGKTPNEIRDYATSNGYKWRRDETRVGGWLMPLDWVTHPEVFQAKLEQSPYPGGDGDCDDYHNWFAACLSKLPSVQRVYIVSSGYPGGGHTTCCFKQNGAWYHVNYNIAPIGDPNKIPQIVADWGDRKHKKGNEVTFYVFEHAYPQWKAVAIGPNGKVPT